MNLSRTIVIGNSGSGKSWLAENLARKMDCPGIDLDTIHWMGNGYGLARDRSDAIELTRSAATGEKWIIEGIYGWLVREIITHATALIWLRLDEEECIANIQHRGRRGLASEESFGELLDWTAAYRSRTGSSSFSAHQDIFDGFSGSKQCLKNRNEVIKFIA